MRNAIIIHDVEIPLTEDQIKLLSDKLSKKKTGYERVEKGHTYYTVNGEGDHAPVMEIEADTDDIRYSIANYYSDKDVCIANAIADRLMRRLRRFAAEKGGIPSQKEWLITDGSIPREPKYYIEFNAASKNLYAASCNRVRIPGVVYFSNENACEAAIQEFHSNLLWYFTTYEPMLKSE